LLAHNRFSGHHAEIQRNSGRYAGRLRHIDGTTRLSGAAQANTLQYGDCVSRQQAGRNPDK